jgi:lipopolysaccharide transport system ATP-binding protein
MNDVSIRVQNLSKSYRIGSTRERSYPLRDLMARAIAKPFGSINSKFRLLRSGDVKPSSQTIINHAELQCPTREQKIWALKDISFEVKRGEVLSIIGRNGEGKSTILKILSRITEPTEGYAEIFGRVGCLLEVGTGFHPELTGRENVYLNGAILGMKRVEIERKFEQIVAFAETEKFLETPVKYYSSGMYVRLAFAVSVHLEPAVLIIDEVLAVGDGAFQKKCLDKVDRLRNEGQTIIFVSHDLSAIRRISDRVMWLRNGRIQHIGETEESTKRYEEFLLSLEDPAESTSAAAVGLS